MKLQQPRNYDFRVSQFDPPRSQSGNDRETTTKVATTVKRRLLHLAIIERQIITLTTTAKPQQLRVNSREMTTFAGGMGCQGRLLKTHYRGSRLYHPNRNQYILKSWNTYAATKAVTVVELGIRLPLTGAEISKIEKRGFRSQTTPISHHPRKGCSESKNPHFYTEHYKENGDFWLGTPFSGVVGNGGFLTRNPLFPILGISAPAKKRSRSEKAILGAILGIPGHSRSNSRNGTHDLIYEKTLFSEQLSERLSELVGRLNFSLNSRSVFLFKIGVVPARQYILNSWNTMRPPKRWR